MARIPTPIVTDQGVIEASYPARIKQVLTVVTAVIGVIAALQYLSYWRIFIGMIWARGPAFFTSAASPRPESAIWTLISAHLMLLMLAPVVIIILALLPDLRAQPDGLAVRYLKRWVLLPWQRITRVDAADLSEQNHILLLETSPKALPFVHRAAALLFDGRESAGVLVTSAISNFEPLLQRTLLAISRTQPADPEEPLFHDNAPAWGIRMMLTPSATIDRLVAEAREDEDTQTIDMQRALKLLRIPAILAAFPALILLATFLVERMLLPTPGRIGVVLALFLWGLLEWPLTATIAHIMEANPELDAEQSRPFYLVPIVQIPRLLPMALAFALAVLSIPVLPTLLWLGAAFWSFLLTAGLFEEMYDWHGPKLLAAAVVPLLFQLLTLAAYGMLLS